tara:strand:+ start:8811 stop:9725 length:915 start_codon:yes stop_codon:yes gene_type:complete
MKIKNLVFSGGQIKGLSYAGVLKALYEKGYSSDIKNVLGVSSGAIFGLAFSLKLTISQIIEIVHKLDIFNLNNISYESFFDFFNTYGIDNCDRINKFIKILLKRKTKNENITFKELYEITKINLIIMGTNLTKKREEFFNHEKTPNMPIWIAIRISINVPVYFEKYEYNKCLYIDGGIICNYPMYYFDNDKENTIGIALQDISKPKNKSNYFKYIYSILNLLIQNTEKIMYKKYYKKTIFLKIKYNVTDFDFTLETKKYLINEGYQQTIKFLENIEYNNEINIVVKNTLDDLIKNLIEKMISNK